MEQALGKLRLDLNFLTLLSLRAEIIDVSLGLVTLLSHASFAQISMN